MAYDVERGLTFAELTSRCLMDGYPRSRETLAYVLRDEVRRGRVAYDAASGRYRLNGSLDVATVEALRALVPDGLGSARESSGRRPILPVESPGKVASCFPELLGRGGGNGAIRGTRGTVR